MFYLDDTQTKVDVASRWRGLNEERNAMMPEGVGGGEMDQSTVQY